MTGVEIFVRYFVGVKTDDTWMCKCGVNACSAEALIAILFWVQGRWFVGVKRDSRGTCKDMISIGV